MTRARPHRRVGALAAVVMTLVISVPAGAQSPVDGEQPDVIGRNCNEFVAWPDVSLGAAQELLPGGYQARREEFGTREDPTADTANLLVVARRCERLEMLGRSDDNVIESYLAVVIEPPVNAPRQSGFGPGNRDASVPLVPLETYLVQWVTNSSLRATWLTQGTGLAAEDVIVVDDLDFDYSPSVNAPSGDDPNFTMKVPPPAPSPYTIEMRVTEPTQGPWDARQNQWWEAPAGTGVIYADGTPSFFGSGQGTITSDDPESLLGKTFGDEDEQMRPTGGDADMGIPADPFAFNFVPVNEWTKAVHKRGIEEEGCSAAQLLFRVPISRVDDLVPAPFKIKEAEDSPGETTLVLIMEKCEDVTIDGHDAGSAIVYHADVHIEHPREFAGDPPPVPEASAFTLFSGTDNHDLLHYLLQQGGAGEGSVEHLSYEIREDGSFLFETPESAASPFKVTATLAPPATPETVLPTHGYSLGRGGVLIADAVVRKLRFGPITEWQIEAARGSLLDRILCDGPRSSTDPRAAARPLDPANATFDASVSVRLFPTNEIGPTDDVECEGGTA